jgi:hypothetical protein
VSFRGVLNAGLHCSTLVADRTIAKSSSTKERGCWWNFGFVDVVKLLTNGGSET